ncbi:MAG: HD domain-containing protein [Clostridia bacterium]|nr:HD domain-containing protein [Clostridia bacterium]
MKRINKIYHHPLYQEIMDKISQLEKDRIYCLHGVEHAMDVARIAYIINLEENASLDKEIIYATALLHDLGRGINYEKHAQQSVLLAQKILPDCDFCNDEIEQIIGAINIHGEDKSIGLSGIIQRADKLSRLCYNCESIDTCKWKKEELNLEIIY